MRAEAGQFSGRLRWRCRIAWNLLWRRAKRGGFDQEEHEVNLSSETGQLDQTAASCDDSGYGGVDEWRKELGDAGDGDPGYRVVLCESTNAGSRVKERETRCREPSIPRDRNKEPRWKKEVDPCTMRLSRPNSSSPSQVVDGSAMAEVRNADRIRKLGDGRRLKIRTSGSQRGGGVMDGAGSKEKKKDEKGTQHKTSLGTVGCLLQCCLVSCHCRRYFGSGHEGSGGINMAVQAWAKAQTRGGPRQTSRLATDGTRQGALAVARQRAWRERGPLAVGCPWALWCG